MRNRIVFNNESWLHNTNYSLPLTPTNTSIHGISGTIKASMQTIVENTPILICPAMTDNVLSQGWLANNKSIMTAYNSIDNACGIAYAKIQEKCPPPHYICLSNKISFLVEA